MLTTAASNSLLFYNIEVFTLAANGTECNLCGYRMELQEERSRSSSEIKRSSSHHDRHKQAGSETEY